MKCVLIAFAALVVVASAGILAPGILPAAYSAPFVAPYAAAPYVAPYAAAPLAVPPVASSGYVAATRGSVHVAPLPEGPFSSSLHINTLPAPGTL